MHRRLEKIKVCLHSPIIASHAKAKMYVFSLVFKLFSFGKLGVALSNIFYFNKVENCGSLGNSTFILVLVFYVKSSDS